MPGVTVTVDEGCIPKIDDNAESSITIDEVAERSYEDPDPTYNGD